MPAAGYVPPGKASMLLGSSDMRHPNKKLPPRLHVKTVEIGDK